jgi:hypothetical protein
MPAKLDKLYLVLIISADTIVNVFPRRWAGPEYGNRLQFLEAARPGPRVPQKYAQIKHSCRTHDFFSISRNHF